MFIEFRLKIAKLLADLAKLEVKRILNEQLSRRVTPAITGHAAVPHSCLSSYGIKCTVDYCMLYKGPLHVKPLDVAR